MNHPPPKLLTGCDRFSFSGVDCGPVCRSGISYPVSTSLLRPPVLNSEDSPSQLSSTLPPFDSVAYENAAAVRNIFGVNDQHMYVGTPPCNVTGPPPPVGFLPRVSYNSFLLNSSPTASDCYSGLYPGSGQSGSLSSTFLSPVIEQQQKSVAAHGAAGGLMYHFPGSQRATPSSEPCHDSQHAVVDSHLKAFGDTNFFSERVVPNGNYTFATDAVSTSLTSWPEQHAGTGGGQGCNGSGMDILAQYYSHHVHGDDRASVVCPILSSGQSSLNPDLAAAMSGVVDYSKFFPKVINPSVSDHQQQQQQHFLSPETSTYFSKVAAAVNPYLGRATGAFHRNSHAGGTFPNYVVDYDRQQQQQLLKQHRPSSGGVIVKSEVSLMAAAASQLPNMNDVANYNMAANFRGSAEDVGSMLLSHGFLPANKLITNPSGSYAVAEAVSSDDLMAMERYKYVQQMGAYAEQGSPFQRTKQAADLRHFVKVEGAMLEDQFLPYIDSSSTVVRSCESVYHHPANNRSDSTSCRPEDSTSPVVFQPLTDFDPVEAGGEIGSATAWSNDKEYAEVFIPVPCLQCNDGVHKVPIYKQHQPRKIEQPCTPCSEGSPYSFTDDEEVACHFSPVNLRSSFPHVDDLSRVQRKHDGGSSRRRRSSRSEQLATPATTSSSSCYSVPYNTAPRKRLKTEKDFCFQPDSAWLTGALKAAAAAEGLSNHSLSASAPSADNRFNARTSDAGDAPLTNHSSPSSQAGDSSDTYHLASTSAASTSSSYTTTDGVIADSWSQRSQPRIVIRIPKYALATDDIRDHTVPSSSVVTEQISGMVLPQSGISSSSVPPVECSQPASFTSACTDIPIVPPNSRTESRASSTSGNEGVMAVKDVHFIEGGFSGRSVKHGDDDQTVDTVLSLCK
ncbi:unnamed protein product [Soboliphyme baturini]|uniref:PUM-HD domain-containing protein n=1 Tax=Soboliphyme baturini TaxID=241478 RepID=A0A183IHK2_9BILA|nr:unnamed protein product [Soboliphyme baturini]